MRRKCVTCLGVIILEDNNDFFLFRNLSKNVILTLGNFNILIKNFLYLKYFDIS